MPRVWEVMFPIATGSQAPKEVDPRVRKAEASLWWFRRLAPGADSVYPMRAWTPHECVAIHSYTLLSEEFVSTCHIPTYEAFLHTADLGPTYLWQKRFLQYLQLGCSNRRWVLKSPDHVYGLDKLLTVFPDAVIIQTHRNPVQVVMSQFQQQGSRKLGLSRGRSLLIVVTRWQSPDYNSLAENFLLHRKRNPFLRRIWIGPQSAEIIEHLLFVLGQSRAL